MPNFKFFHIVLQELRNNRTVPFKKKKKKKKNSLQQKAVYLSFGFFLKKPTCIYILYLYFASPIVYIFAVALLEDTSSIISTQPSSFTVEELSSATTATTSWMTEAEMLGNGVSSLFEPAHEKRTKQTLWLSGLWFFKCVWVVLELHTSVIYLKLSQSIYAEWTLLT